MTYNKGRQTPLRSGEDPAREAAVTRLEDVFRSATLCRTLGYLALLPETAEARIEDLVAVAQVTRPAVLDALTTLQDSGLAEFRRDSRRILYSFNRAHPLAQPLIALFEAANSFEAFSSASSAAATAVSPAKTRKARGAR